MPRNRSEQSAPRGALVAIPRRGGEAWGRGPNPKGWETGLCAPCSRSIRAPVPEWMAQSCNLLSKRGSRREKGVGIRPAFIYNLV